MALTCIMVIFRRSEPPLIYFIFEPAHMHIEGCFRACNDCSSNMVMRAWLFFEKVDNCYGFIDEGLLETLLVTLLSEAECCYPIRSSVSRLDYLSTHKNLPTDRLS